MLQGILKKDHKTKTLCKRLQPGDIALIDHQDLDELAAQELVEKDIKAVINACNIFTGEYPAQGAKYLLDKGIYTLDNVSDKIFFHIPEGEVIKINGNSIYYQGRKIGQGRVLKSDLLQHKLALAERNLNRQLDLFVQNTLDYVRKEKHLILGNLEMPELRTKFAGKHVLIVIRGKNYKQDLQMIRSYIRDVKPVLIGVDGGGDALCEIGLKPHLIIGDMDSVEDATLRKAGEIVVHAYRDGFAPGRKRISRLGLKAKIIAAPGTSEDLAFLLAYEKKAELIVAVGSHSHMLDFLEKGRKGMASTFLVRLKVGHKLVDAKGLAHLYQGGVRWQYLSVLLAAALFPIAVMAAFSPLVRHFFYLLSWRFGLH
ncbi:MAG: putative cytokinetic ring protein SteA [Dethiobacteria bacterium]